MKSESRNRSVVEATALSFLFSRPNLRKVKRSRKRIFSSFQLTTLGGSAAFNAMVILTFALSMIVMHPSTRAANPAAGTISPAGPTQIWDGTAVGGSSAGEDTCQEGVNCD